MGWDGMGWDGMGWDGMAVAVAVVKQLATLEAALIRYGSHSLTPTQVKELIAQLDPGDSGNFNYNDVWITRSLCV